MDGPLELSLVYPPEDGTLTVRDSTFVFGATGTGRAGLSINGHPVDVAPNGAFLAFLPVPEDGVYRLVAEADGRTATLERRVEIPAPPRMPAPGEAMIVAASVQPRGAWAALPGERIEVGFRGTAGGAAALVLPDGSRIPLAERRRAEDVDWGQRAFGTDPHRLAPAERPVLATYHGFFLAEPLVAADTGLAWPQLAEVPAAAAELPPDELPPDMAERRAAAVAAGEPAPRDTLAPGPDALPAPVAPPVGAAVELVVGTDTARVPLPLNLALLDPDRPRVAVVALPAAYPVTEGRARAAAGPGHTFHYFWNEGTELTLTGERAGRYRVRLAPDRNAWIPAEEVRLAAPGTPPAGGRVGTVRFQPTPAYIDVRLALDRRLPYRIDPDGDRIVATVYGGIGDTGWLMYGGLDPYIRRAAWDQPADSVYRLTLELVSPAWGYAVFWDANEDLVLRVRRPPSLDPRRPLLGLTIAVDPGHPPGGATGPTGLREADAALATALLLRAHLERAGANVVMTRTEDVAVGLYERTRIAEEAGAHIFVSVHYNAFPDGVNPFENNGTSVFYFHPHSADLATAFQRELLAELRLRDLGIGRSSLAVVRRLEWMPAALTETAFMMIPEQESALRAEGILDRIARAHVRALERFVRERGGAGAQP